MNTVRKSDERDYSKEEILELIEQTKEKYGFSDMSDLGTVLGEYNHNWYYYYKNKAKKTPAFLDTLLSVQNPFEMFERLRNCTDALMKKKSMEKNDMKKFCHYVEIMISCLGMLGIQWTEDMNREVAKIPAAEDIDNMTAYISDLDNLNYLIMQGLDRFVTNTMYIVQLACYLDECRMRGIQEGITARNKGRKDLNLKSCYEKYYGTQEFELSRTKNLSEESEKMTCWYKERCNSIKKCKIYEYTQRLEKLKEIQKDFTDILHNASDRFCVQEEYFKIFEDVSRMLRELELPEI